jgi:hypothetical protein
LRTLFMHVTHRHLFTERSWMIPPHGVRRVASMGIRLVKCTVQLHRRTKATSLLEHSWTATASTPAHSDWQSVHTSTFREEAHEPRHSCISQTARWTRAMRAHSWASWQEHLSASCRTWSGRGFKLPFNTASHDQGATSTIWALCMRRVVLGVVLGVLALGVLALMARMPSWGLARASRATLPGTASHTPPAMRAAVCGACPASGRLPGQAAGVRRRTRQTETCTQAPA